MFQGIEHKDIKISVSGLGYVGLPLALALAEKFSVIGYDLDSERIAQMQQGHDPSREIEKDAFTGKNITFTSDPEDLKAAGFHIVAVPTPVDDHRVPNLKHLIQASETLGRILKKGDYVVFESTVYPGCTEEDCIPVIERISGLEACKDFKYGYSPERINPGERGRPIQSISKIVSGCDEEALKVISDVYGAIIEAGIYQAPSVKVAEAAKVIENTQRDLNISFVNELAIIFDKMGIDTREVLEAAGTKWNFVKYTPGLVGGHCIGVDPYYLLYKSKQLGYDPQVILSGRRINDGMPHYIARKLVQKLLKKGKRLQDTKVLVMGVTFKENVADIRNSKVADLVHELIQYSVNVDITDPHADPVEVERNYAFKLISEPCNDYDAVVVAVNHREFTDLTPEYFRDIMNGAPILFDIKSIYDSAGMEDIEYWRL